MRKNYYSAVVLCLFALPFGLGMIGKTEIASAAIDAPEDATPTEGATTRRRRFVPPTAPVAPTAPESWPAVVPRDYSGVFGRNSNVFFGLTGAERGRDEKISTAARALRQAESKQDRESSMDILSELLEEDYDERLNGYEEYLDQLEQQLGEMRTKLQKRRQAKSDMVELRIKVLEAEADDLGWPDRAKPKFPLRLDTTRSKNVPALPRPKGIAR